MFCLSQIASFFGTFRLAWTLKLYNASLNANRNAAVITLCVTLGPIPTATPTLASPLPLPVEHQTRTFIQPAPPLFADTPPQAPHHPLRLPLLITSDMHPALHRNIRIRDPRRQQLPHRPQEEHIQRLHLPPSLQHIPQLLEDRILQYRVHNQHQRRQHARKQCRGAFVSKKREEGPDCSWLFRGGRGLECGEFFFVGGGGEGGRTGGHARIDDPDGVRDEHGGGAGEGAGEHGLEGCELFGGAGGADGGALEEGAGVFVPWREG